MKVSKLFTSLFLFAGIISCQKNIAQTTYSTDFDGTGSGSTITVPSSGSGSAIIPPSCSQNTNHQNIGTKPQTTYKQSAPAAPSTSTIVTGMIMQSIISGLFAPDTKQQEANAQAAQAEAQRIAAQQAELKRIQDSINQAKYNKLMDYSLSLPNSGNSNLKPLSLPTNPPPPLPNSVPDKPKDEHKYIEMTRDALVTLVGVAPGPLGYVSIAAVDIWAENAKAIKDVWDGKPCPQTSEILTNALKQTTLDESIQAAGNIGGIASGKIFSSLADRSMIKKAVLPGIEGVVTEGRIAEIGAGHFAIASAGVDCGKRILNAWGIGTAYDDPK